MYRVRLTKGRSYSGYGVKVTAARPLAEINDHETLDAIVATGRFVVETALPVYDDESEKKLKESLVEKMTEKELEEYASENAIDLTGLKGKTPKLMKIQETLAELDGGIVEFISKM